MAHVLEEFGLPFDIWTMIERINLNKSHLNVLTEFEIKYQYYWKEKFRNYENRFFSGFLKDRFGELKPAK